MVASKDQGSSSVTPELSRELSLFHLTMMGLGMMIGAGVFVGMGRSIGIAGPGGAVLTFVMNGLLAMLTAMSFAELSSAIPRAGGAYNFARIGFGRQASFITGWMEWFASSVAGSMYALTFAMYTVRFVRLILGHEAGTEAGSGEMLVVKAVAVITAGTFIYINFRGASETGKIGAIITMGQMTFLLVIGGVGIYTVIRDPSRLENFVDFMPNKWPILFVTMGLTYVAFEGYEVIAQAGDEAIDPRKNLPKAMIYSVFIVTIIYLVVSFATIVSVKSGVDGVEGPAWKWIGSFGLQGFGAAVAKLMPYKGLGNFILTLAVIFSSTSALNATIYSATRSSYALGRDKMLPGIFASIHKVRNTPYGALIFTGVIILVTATLLPTEKVVASASIMFLFLFLMVNLCVIKIRRSMADELIYGFMMPLFPLFPIVAIVCQGVLAIELREISMVPWIIAPGWIAIGFVIYHLYSKSRAIATEDEIQTLQEETHHEEYESDRYRVMVAVANPANATELVQSTYKLCGAKQAKVELLHMVPVPDQVSLTDAEKYITAGREALLEAMLYLSMHFPIKTTLRYCRNAARGIVSAVREKKTDMLVLGWHGKPSAQMFNIGSTVDPIIEQSPCNVVMLKDCGGNKEFKNVLVPLAGGPNGKFALDIASIMAGDDGKITAFTVDTGNGAFEIDKFCDEQAQSIGIDRSRIQTRTTKAKSAVLAILKETKNYDLVVLGTTDKPLLVQMTRQSLPEKIACRCKKPIVMVKSNVGMRSWIRRWI